jgi:dTDP-4-dehydrorhamnose 3,5-epimerase
MAFLHWETKVHDCRAIETTLFEDTRGNFVETWSQRDFWLSGLPTEWAQDNIINSKKNVLRGLHLQTNNPQGRLVRCIAGAVWNVCLDLRRDSPTFFKWHGELLSGARAMYCPPGTAHGFLAMEPDSVVYCKCTTLWDKESDCGVQALDPDVGITWPSVSNAFMSTRDMTLPPALEWLESNRGR